MSKRLRVLSIVLLFSVCLAVSSGCVPSSMSALLGDLAVRKLLHGIGGGGGVDNEWYCYPACGWFD